MDKLELFELYEKTPNINNKFSKSLDAKLNITTNTDIVECDIQWLEIMEDTIRYLDNILRNPNRFIINEEDIVKIELARRVTVDSIKHLSKNTNFIQKIEDNGDVKPSKILNINKEESFNTYENRFIYSLIQNMKLYIDRKKRTLATESSLKKHKKFEYQGATSVNNEKITMSLCLETNVNKVDQHKDINNHDLLERIERLEADINNLTTYAVYQDLHKLHISLVTSPNKKTNVILKNTNFQYALKLWNYMQDNMSDGTKREKKNQSYEDNGKLKEYINETFLLDYLIANTLEQENNNTQNEKEIQENKKELSKKLINNALNKVVNLNPNISEEELKDLIGEQVVVIKYKNKISTNEINKIIKKSINNYVDKIESNKI